LPRLALSFHPPALQGVVRITGLRIHPAQLSRTLIGVAPPKSVELFHWEVAKKTSPFIVLGIRLLTLKREILI
jgi:hypothetical protein